MNIRPEYEKELEDLRIKMLDAQKFAEMFPCFSEKILKNKWGNRTTGKIDDSYGGLYFAWGINRFFYKDRGNITNYRGDFSPLFLWKVYINELSIFGEVYTDTGIDDIKNTVDLFFYDALNCTFYATDKQIVPLLDALAEWYSKAKVINNEYINERKKSELRKQLQKLEGDKD